MAFHHFALVLVIFNCVYNSYLLGDCKVLLSKWENCDDNPNYKLKFKFSFKTVGDKQYADSTFVFLAPVGNNLQGNISVETLVGDKFIYLFSFNEKKACDAMSKYFGEFWYDMERHAGIIPRHCPIAEAIYHLHNFLLDWSKMTTLHNFPFGHLRFTFTVYDSKNIVTTCFVLEGTNEI